MITRAQKKLLFLSSLGGVLEFYDFVIYALFSTYISQTFFPTDSGLAPLIAMTLIKKTAWVAAPMLFLIFSGILALFALFIYQSKKRTSRLQR